VRREAQVFERTVNSDSDRTPKARRGHVKLRPLGHHKDDVSLAPDEVHSPRGLQTRGEGPDPDHVAGDGYVRLGDRALDVYCGTGDLAPLLAQRVGPGETRQAVAQAQAVRGGGPARRRGAAGALKRSGESASRFRAARTVETPAASV
jgi:hypothetical protein